MNSRAATGPGRLARSPRELVPRVGRAVLWAGLAVVLVRGVSATLASRHAEALPPVVAARAVWPDDAARAFAVEFAITYLEQPPPGASKRLGVAALAAPELAEQLVLRSQDPGRRLVLRAATPAGAVGLDARHALITVAAVVVGDAPARTLRLTVPVPVTRGAPWWSTTSRHWPPRPSARLKRRRAATRWSTATSARR